MLAFGFLLTAQAITLYQDAFFGGLTIAVPYRRARCRPVPRAPHVHRASWLRSSSGASSVWVTGRRS